MSRFDYENKRIRLGELEGVMGGADFWNNQEEAKKIIAKLKLIKAQTDPIKALYEEFEDAKLAYEMSREDNDEDLLTEADDQLFTLNKRMGKIETQSLLSGKHDTKACFFTISAGDGGTEANDWCEMLFRMYLYYFENQGWKIEEVEKSFGSEVGLDSVHAPCARALCLWIFELRARNASARTGVAIQRAGQTPDELCDGGCDS